MKTNRIAFMWIISALVCLTFFSSVYSAQHISGDIQSITFAPAQGPYIVEKDIIVPAGKRVDIPAGCVFLFKPFTGLRVEGDMIVKGDQDNPVVFTSIHDAKYNPSSAQLPNPFDWNGILISTASTGSYFNNFALSYSVYGVKSQSQNVIIQNGFFHQNGQFHFTVNDQIQNVQDNIPFSYGSAPAPSQDKSSSRSKKNRASDPKAKKIIRFTCLGVGLVGAGVGTVFAIRTAQRTNELDTWEISRPANEWEDANTKRGQSFGGAIASYSIAALGLVGFGVTFAF